MAEREIEKWVTINGARVPIYKDGGSGLDDKGNQLDKKLMGYIPKEYKPYVADIYEGEKEWNDVTQRWNRELVVEWENGETSYFANKAHAKQSLKEMYSIDDVKKRS